MAGRSVRIRSQGILNSRAREALEELNREGEQGFLRNFGIRAVELGQIGRIDLFGLSRPDILDYLPASSVVPNAAGRGWAELRADSGSKTGTAFKRWLSANLDFSGDDSVLKDAVSQLDALDGGGQRRYRRHRPGHAIFVPS